MSVYKAINLVQMDLCKQGISKDSTNTFDNYKFRGIDAVYNALSPLLAKHGLCILPRMLSRSVEQHTSQKGGILFYVTVEAEFDFVSAEDGSKHTVKTFGEAMDRGDKATNKAMSAAYKYAAFQTFAIPTEGDNDADASTHVSSGKITPTAGAWESMAPDEQIWLQDIANQAISLINKGDIKGAVQHIQDQNLQNEEKVALTTRFDSKQRSAMVKAREEMEKEKEKANVGK